MSRVCRITPRASRDIEAIADYLAVQSSLASAERFLSGIDSTLQRIAQFPQIGRKRDELYPGSLGSCVEHLSMDFLLALLHKQVLFT